MSDIYLDPKRKWVSPVEALGVIRAAQMTPDCLTDVYEQLLENAPGEARVATEHILAHTRKYSAKLCKLAEKQAAVALAKNVPTAARLTEWPVGAELLQTRTDVFFDGSVFKTTCAELNRSEFEDRWLAQVTNLNSMCEVVRVIPHIFRVVFVEKYIQKFDQALAG